MPYCHADLRRGGRRSCHMGLLQQSSSAPHARLHCFGWTVGRLGSNTLRNAGRPALCSYFHASTAGSRAVTRDPLPKQSSDMSALILARSRSSRREIAPLALEAVGVAERGTLMVHIPSGSPPHVATGLHISLASSSESESEELASDQMSSGEGKCSMTCARLLGAIGALRRLRRSRLMAERRRAVELWLLLLSLVSSS